MMMRMTTTMEMMVEAFIITFIFYKVIPLVSTNHPFPGSVEHFHVKFSDLFVIFHPIIFACLFNIRFNLIYFILHFRHPSSCHQSYCYSHSLQLKHTNTFLV